MLFQVLGLWLHLNKIFLGLGLPVTKKKSTETKNKEQKCKKDVGMAHQEVYKQDRDDSIKAKVNIRAMPHRYIFFTLQLDTMLET